MRIALNIGMEPMMLPAGERSRSRLELLTSYVFYKVFDIPSPCSQSHISFPFFILGDQNL
jgi:hypothetical protein